MADRTPGFVHLHNHTTYSLLDGAQRLDEMLRARGCGRAVLDRDHRSRKPLRRARVRAGGEEGGHPADRRHRSVRGAGLAARQGTTQAGGARQKPYHHLILLAESYVGYKNLIKLSTAGFLEGFYYRPRIDKELLRAAQRRDRLPVGVPGRRSSRRSCEATATTTPRTAAAEFSDLFGPDRYWLELQDHGIEEQEQVNEGSVRPRQGAGLGLVATNDCHYLLPSDHFAHDVLVCIQTGKTIHSARPDPLLASALPQEPRGDGGAVRLDARRGREHDGRRGALRVHVRKAACDPSRTSRCRTASTFRRTSRRSRETASSAGCRAGAPKATRGVSGTRSTSTATVCPARSVSFHEMGFAGYFLIVWDFIRFARENGIPVGPGRGSAAGSLVAYCLQITDIDPHAVRPAVRAVLESRADHRCPTSTSTSASGTASAVIDYVTGKYGRPNVAQIITFGTMAARAVIRDVGRGLDIPYAEVDKIAKLVPQQPGQDITIDKALAEVPALKQAYESDPKVQELIDVGAPSRRTRAACLDPRRRRGDRPPADRRVRAAVPRDRRRRSPRSSPWPTSRRSASSRWTSSA